MASMRWVGASGVDGAALLAEEAHEQIKVVELLKREPTKRRIYPTRDSGVSPWRDEAPELTLTPAGDRETGVCHRITGP